MLKIFKRVSLILCAVALLTVIAVPAVKSVAYATNNEQAEAVTYAENEVVIPAETETSATENRDNSKGSKAIAAGICVGLAAALGALANYISTADPKNFQPMNVNFGIMTPLGYKVKGKANKNLAIAERSLAIIDQMVREHNV